MNKKETIEIDARKILKSFRIKPNHEIERYEVTPGLAVIMYEKKGAFYIKIHGFSNRGFGTEFIRTGKFPVGTVYSKSKSVWWTEKTFQVTKDGIERLAPGLQKGLEEVYVLIEADMEKKPDTLKEAKS
jgi:hypothetical protein